jgi:exodeoxyribonuclease III
VSAVKIATWNVNSLNVRLPRVLEFLDRHRPDVLCMQETKSDPDRFPRRELREAGYVSADHSAGRWAGVAIAAREELGASEVCAGLAGEPAVDEARWIEADVGGIRIVSTYVPNGRAVGTETFHDKLAFLDAMADRAAALRGRPLVIAGDLNVTRADLDVYDPAAFAGSTHVTADERSRLERLLAEGGLVDSYRALNPDEVGYTWWDYRAGHFHKRLGLRIDYILASDDVAARLSAAGIDRSFRKGQKPSDHAPLIAWLDGSDEGADRGRQA